MWHSWLSLRPAAHCENRTRACLVHPRLLLDNGRTGRWRFCGYFRVSKQRSFLISKKRANIVFSTPLSMKAG
jgi:hypothetical protein